MKVFLGGTTDGFDWRKFVMKELDKLGIEYLNPSTDDYTKEIIDRCDVVLFTAADGNIPCIYTITDLIDTAVKRGHRVVFCNMCYQGQMDPHMSNNVSARKMLANAEETLSRYTRFICHDLYTAVKYVESLKTASIPRYIPAPG